MKEDCQAFVIVISRVLGLEEAFKYPIKSVPLFVATPDGDLWQSNKASLRNCLIEQSNSTTRDIPKKASWLINGLAAVQTLIQINQSLLRFMTPPDVAEAILVGMVNDTYQELSAKSSTRKRRGEELQRTYIEGIEQQMPTGIKWNEFLRNSKNKEQCTSIVAMVEK